MADTTSDDPWAGHVPGLAPTPIAEGDDPLSGVSLNSQTGLTASKTSARNLYRQPSSPVLSARWGSTDHSGANKAEDSDPLSEVTIGRSLDAGGSTHKVVETSMSASQSGTSQIYLPDDVSQSTILAEEVEDDEEDHFVYPGGSRVTEDNDFMQKQTASTPPMGGSSLFANVHNISPGHDDRPVSSSSNNPVLVDYGALSRLCSHGPLTALQEFFHSLTEQPAVEVRVSVFALANEPVPTSGLAPIHYAAREGRVDILRWLIGEAGALIEMEDREGETALHKASLAGRLPAVTCLLSSGAEASCVDGDGWTPLHNACSRGYLDIVKVLLESDSSSIDVKGGRGGWTPLMNASSHGHLPVVRYLTSRYHADPFVRSRAGETAYDVAAATFEIYICELLEKYESDRWLSLRYASAGEGNGSRDRTVTKSPGQGPYNPLALHTTVPVVVHENQRLDTRLSTLALRGGRPRWSGTQAGRPDKTDRRAPGSMPPGPLSVSRTRHVPMRRDDIRLPSRKDPYKARLARKRNQTGVSTVAGTERHTFDDLASTPTPESSMNSMNQSGVARGSDVVNEDVSHFWLSEWQVDLTHPQVDAESGWQYSQSFDSPDERWIATPPPPLLRLLEGRGVGQSVHKAMTGALSTSESADAELVNSGWVRRRRWVRVMRRRLDIEFGDALEAAEAASISITAVQQSSTQRGVLVSAAIIEAQQVARSEAEKLGPAADYLERSSAMAGQFDMSPTVTGNLDEARQQIARLGVAIDELRSHTFSDDDDQRQARAESLLKAFTAQQSRLKQAAGIEEGSDEEEDDDDDEEFIYPNSYRDDGQSVITRIGAPPSVTQDGIVPIRTRSTPSEAGTSMGATRVADLANASEFRVPNNEIPNRPVQAGNQHLEEQNLLPMWEVDSEVVNCRGCNRKFTFFLRKHHCRRCGRIYCDACSNHRVMLPVDEIVIDPGIPEMMTFEANGPTRICDTCEAERSLPAALRNPLGFEAMSDAINRIDAEQDTSGTSDASSRASELNECPVCGTILAGLGGGQEQEDHIRGCLENGGGGSVQSGRYLIYKLGEGPIVGKECQICLEDLCVGMTIARLPCLCYYHRHCIDSWFSRGRCCPVHARSW